MTKPATGKPLEDAPLYIYLDILRQEGYEEEASIIEPFYLETLTNVDIGDGKRFTKEQIMNTPYKNLMAAVKLILDQAQQEIQLAVTPAPTNGPIMTGNGADKLSPDALRKLMSRQLQMHEEEKLRLGFG